MNRDFCGFYSLTLNLGVFVLILCNSGVYDGEVSLGFVDFRGAKLDVTLEEFTFESSLCQHFEQ